MQKLGKSVASEMVLVVGGNIVADIAGGLQAGFKTAWVLTRVTSMAKLTVADIRPDLVFQSLKQLFQKLDTHPILMERNNSCAKWGARLDPF